MALPSATGAPVSAAPGWGAPDAANNGWQAWGSIFTLPLTNVHWPAKYFNAPLPTAPNVVATDLAEAAQRLGPLKLSATDTPAQQQAHLQSLRDELTRLVSGWPGAPLNKVPLQAPTSGANAPSLTITVMDQLLLLALDPYFARVLGLYFVDTQTVAGVKYDYAIVGYWGNNQADVDVIYPGLAPAGQLASGHARWQGLTISKPSTTSIWRWIRDTVSFLQLDPTAPSQSASLVNMAIAGEAAADQPKGIMILGSGLDGAPASPTTLRIGIPQGTPAVSIQLAGSGTATAYSRPAGQSALDSLFPVTFNSTQFTTVTLTADILSPIVEVLITAAPPLKPPASFLLVGAVTIYATPQGAAGNLYALVATPAAITPPPAPGQPVTTFRKRRGVIDTAALKVVPKSLFDVEWPAPPPDPSAQTGDPYGNPRALPPPTQAIGFVIDRRDNGPSGGTKRLPGWVAARSVPKGAGSKIPSPTLYRQSDSGLPDPSAGSAGYSHAVAGFDIFGVQGAPSPFSHVVGVEKIAASPTALRILQFDNSTAGGGAALPDGSAWSGGTLNLQAAWDASAFMMYPDIASAKAQLVSLANGGATSPIGSSTFSVPAPLVAKVLATVTPNPLVKNADGYSYNASITTVPPLPVLADSDPAMILMLTAGGSDPVSLSFSVRPVAGPSGGVAQITVSSISRLVTSPAAFQGQPAYLVRGWSTKLLVPVPLTIPADQQTARGQVYIVGSTQTPFLDNEQIADPNGVDPNRPEPHSVALTFTGAQRIVPAAPATPLPDVNHVYYDPADLSGQAGKDLPFTTPSGTGLQGYVLKRAAVHALALADIARRRKAGNAFDANPVLATNGQNLAAYIAGLPQWLAAFNAIQKTFATAANLLDSAEGQRAFIEHFYGGLLDGELRALGDLTANAPAFARVNPTPLPPSSNPIRDTVDGTGYGRNLYKLAAVNHAGSNSTDTGSVGPVYTRIVTPPRPPVLYKVQPAPAAIVVAWALDANPDVSAYLVYRGASMAALADLRYFGADPSHPAPIGSLWSISANTQTNPALTFHQATGGNADPRLIGFVPDPRLVARDYPNSVMAEVVLPPGPPPDAVNAVYRLSDYNAAAGATQVGFNYWTLVAGGIPAMAQTSPTQTRLIGLRVGLGRGVPVVVVATWGGVKKAIGVVPNRRAGFVDAVASPTTPADANAIAGTLPPSTTGSNFYAIVSVDIFGNRSAPSKVFAGGMLGTP